MMKLNVFLSLAGMASATSVNPIRKVVTLMQEMQKEVEAEGEKEEELFKKFMCYCKGNTDTLSKQASDSAAAAEDLSAKAKAETSEKKQVDADLAQSKKDRADAKADLAKATKLREKEAKLYAETNADSIANLKATEGAIAALEKGMGVAFMQTSAGSTFKSFLEKNVDSANLDVEDKETIASFLEGDYAPASGQIVGILKNMKDNMEKDISEQNATEEEAIASFNELKAAKQKEIQATTDAIENLTKRSGELAVSIVQNKNAAEDAAEESADATEFLANLKKNCASKEKEWEVRQETRAQEIEAISQAIAILNEDDALDLFKKTMRTPTAEELHAEKQNAFLQVRSTKSNKLSQLRAKLSGLKISQAPVALLQNSLLSKIKSMEKSGKVDFSKVLKMIDDMVALLTKEQKDDETSRDWCNVEFDKSDDSEKELVSNVKSLDSSLAEMRDEIESLKTDIKNTQDKIASLDTTVAEASEQRKKENAEFTATTTANNMAVELIGKAKNKLMKFYNPDLAVEEAPEEYVPTAEDIQSQKIADAAAGVFVQVKMSQPEAPGTWGESYEAKGQKSGGIMALMDNLIKELDTNNKEAEYDEKTAQKDYEELLAEAQKTRADDVKTVADKEGAKADTEVSLEEAKSTHSLKTTALQEVRTYIADLHKTCDFILKSFEERREARTHEIEGLKNAKSVLSGADYSFF